jgi:hypothetical protein
VTTGTPSSLRPLSVHRVIERVGVPCRPSEIAAAAFGAANPERPRSDHPRWALPTPLLCTRIPVNFKDTIANLITLNSFYSQMATCYF